MADSGAQEMVRRRRGRAALVALFGIVLLLLAALWLARKPIATDLIDRELARRGVPARYEVKRMGFRTQRLEGLVIGDPRAPDLTAEWICARPSALPKCGRSGRAACAFGGGWSTGG
jgi:hypothetical protein